MMARGHRWTPASILSRAREVLRNEGLRSLFFRTLGEIAYRRVIVFESDLRGIDREPPCPDGLRFGLLDQSSMSRFLAISQLCDEPEARRRLAAGQLCVLGCLDEKPVYCSWLALPEQPVFIDFMRVGITPAPGCAYSYELYVDPSCRRLGVARAGLAARVRILEDRGVQHLVSVVVPENQGGIGHTRTAGMRPVGRLHAVRFLGFQRAWLRCEIDPPPLRLLR